MEAKREGRSRRCVRIACEGLQAMEAKNVLLGSLEERRNAIAETLAAVDPGPHDEERNPRLR